MSAENQPTGPTPPTQPTQPTQPLRGTAAALRAEFDRAFAATPAIHLHRPTRFLAARLGGDPFALRLDDLLGLYADRVIVPLPGPARTLRGITSFRGALTPVHDLSLALGYAASTEPRWLVLVATAAGPVGLAFDVFEGQFETLEAAEPSDPPEVSTKSSFLPTASAPVSPHRQGVVRALDVARPVVDIPSVLVTLGIAVLPRTGPRSVDR